MARLVLKLPEGLAKKVEEAANEANMLPTEWVRDLLREAFADAESDESEDGEPDEAEPDE